MLAVPAMPHHMIALEADSRPTGGPRVRKLDPTIGLPVLPNKWHTRQPIS